MTSTFGFKCPQCGSSHFGSEIHAGEVVERHCNGYKADGQGCRFKWKPVDDARYGLRDVDLQEEPDSIGAMVSTLQPTPLPPTTFMEQLVFLPDSKVGLSLSVEEAYQLPKEELEKRHDINTCELGPSGECLYCGILACPHKEPLHFHHDGCPACD